MDHDDDDFQGQNHQLAGEGNSKFSPVLRPYALPKFDFDDSLQGHLRFDTLVENEVFLGIPSQEDNQWIEDYSRGNTGLEFSSSAAESCSISRRNNVWSEATSSESVEMLLKSVAHGEMMLPGDTIIEESEGFDELDGSLTNQTDHPDLSQHDKTEDVDQKEVDNFDSVVISEENVAITGKPDNSVPMDVDDSVNRSLNENIQDDRLLTDNTYTPFEDTHHDLPVDGQGKEGVDEQHIKSLEVNDNDKISTSGTAEETCDFNNRVESVKSHLSGEITLVEYKETSSVQVIGDSDVQIGGGESSKDLFSIVDPALVFTKEASTAEQFGGTANEESPVVLEENNVEVGSGSVSGNENFHESDTQLDAKDDKKATEEFSLVTRIEEGGDSNPVVQNDSPPVVFEENNDEVGGGSVCGNENFHERDTQLDDKGDEKASEEASLVNRIEESGDSSPVVQNDSTAVEVFPPLVDGSMQSCEEHNISVQEGDVHKGGEVCPLPENDNSLEYEALPVGENMKDHTDEAHGEVDACNENNPAANNVTIETVVEVTDHNEELKSTTVGTGLAYDDKQEGVEVGVSTSANLSKLNESSDSVSSVERGKSVNTIQNVNEVVDQPVLIVETSCIPSNVNEPVANIVGEEGSGKMEVVHTYDSKNIAMSDKAEIVAFGNREKVMVEGYNEDASIEVPDALPIPDQSDDINKPLQSAVEISPAANHEANQIIDSDSQTVGVNTGVVDSVPSSEAGDIPTDIDKTNCGSPTIISGIQVSHNERDKNEGNLCPTFQNDPLYSATTDPKFPSISKETDSLKEVKSFTFEVSPSVVLSEGETGKVWKSFPSIQASTITTNEGGSPSKSSIDQTSITIPQEIPQSTPQTIEVETTQRGSKATPERKPRRSSAKPAGKEGGRKGSHMKEKTKAIELDRIGDNKSLGSTSPLVSVPLVVKSEEFKPYGNVERNGAKASGVSSVPASNLPDLNTSVSPASSFQQPFTDVQQVQLRAQIFVYGSLIQGVAPDETCMVSAFGPSDGGRSAWDTKWRAYVERIHVQKSTANNTESPAQARTSELRNAGTSSRTTDHATKHASSTPAHENQVLSTPVGRSSTKSTPSGTTVGVVTPQQSVNPIIPLSSPLWNIPTPSSERNPLLDYHQALSPLNPYQQQQPPPQPVRNFVAGPTPSWLSQAAFPGPWIASPQASSYDVNACFSRFPATESVKLTPVKESSAPFSTSVKHASPIPLPHIVGPPSAVSLSTAEQQPKSRKRKKVLVTEDLSPIPLPPHVHIENKKIETNSGDLAHHSISLHPSTKPEWVSAPAVNAHFSASVAVTSNNSGKMISVLSPTSATDMHAKQGEYSREKKSLDPYGAGNIVDFEVAKVQAEEAASHAAVAVSNCEDVWSRLVKQKNSGLVSSDIEATLASAAVASAAAASVAKAAAAAAKIASNAAVRAKLMVEEALATQNTVVSFLPDTNNTSQATISKGGDGSKSSSSIILAAKEAARKRIETATAASKHAENLEAIVKAAELAAEAVSQAGKIVAMGDPLALNELLAFSPEGYRNQFKTDSFEKAGPGSAKQPDERQSDIEKVTISQNEPAQKAISGDLQQEGHFSAVDVISGTGTSEKTKFKGKPGHQVSVSGKTVGLVPEAEFGSISTSDIGQDEFEKEDGSSSEKIIKQGCLVEVLRDVANGKSGWFSARVLRLKDEKAFVGYTELKHDKEQLEEWVPLGEKGNKAPKIRIAHPMSTMHHSEGTRKRRRSALSDYTWSIGDKVDAWIEDCWCEGFVTKKNTKDETTFTVSFPGHGEKSVKAWDLRPTLVYKDREWIQWSNSRVLERTSQGDTPKEKRAKTEDNKGMEKAWKFNEDEQPEKHGESRLLLPLSMGENTFSIGKSTGMSSKIDSVGGPMRTTGFQGPGVNSGVPKPGKKRKFMAVSEHYISESSSNKNKTPVPNHSVKFTKYLIPQGSRGSKIEAKEKQGVELKSKAPRSSGRTILPQKVITDCAGKNSSNNNNSMNEESESSQQKSMEFKSNPEVVSGGLVFSSKPLAPDAVATTKRLPPLSKVKASERKMNKGKVVSGKSTRVVEVKERSVPDVVEPQRRSNRKIQPTSRLLEGLQSQLIISKIPSASHDKSHRSHNRGTSKGN